MKANAPEKLYIFDNPILDFTKLSSRKSDKDIEYTRTDAFIEKALKWYCLDCECNDNCKNVKCFFYREYERYLKGKADAVPPKFSGGILNEDGLVSDHWRYRHFICKMQDDFIEKVAKWLEHFCNEHYIMSYSDSHEVGLNELIDIFKKKMKE